MHEMGLCDGLLDAVLRRARGRTVRGVRVRVGGHPVDPEVIDQGFRLAAAGTVAADARVDVVSEPLTACCRGCGARTAAHDVRALSACPRCGGVDVEMVGREDVVLESITVERGPGDDVTGDETTGTG